MQRINVVDLNPAFLEIFLGTAVVAVVCIVASFLAWSGVRSVLILLAGILYLVGSFSLTMCFNVPGSERLARIDSSSSEAAA